MRRGRHLISFGVPQSLFFPSLAKRASADHLRKVAHQISDYHEAGHWIHLILSVLHDEPFVAIEPENGVGIVGRFSGIVDNFQLHVLLMDALPHKGLFSRRRVSKSAAATARGEGPQCTNDTVTGAWNLYSWQGIGEGLVLSNSDELGASEHWIWNEGMPSDIPLFEKRRAILLGPASYQRQWRSQRMFDGLFAQLEVERELTNEETQQWLSRMLSAKDHG